ncbi:MAG: amino acid dehydrogenase, partial [Alphaproteobacteria bacterium]|nr:amino acid dehydrogenase [Alphaproteobacteria bacterium]
MSIFSHPDFNQHERILGFYDATSGTKGIIAIHNTFRGPALGGCRIWPYVNEAEAFKDALRLSRGMTYKAAL